jgi:hypothetical protein
MVATEVGVRCASCGNRLAHDHADTICSPCRRTEIEKSARHVAHLIRDPSGIAAAFDAEGLYGVADHLDCSPSDALDVLLSSRLVPFVSSRRHQLLRQLVALGDCSHIAAAEDLNISRWTVATYRQLLGFDRAPVSSTRLRAIASSL